MKRNVSLRNFETGEDDCTCGCGKITSEELLVRLQAFVYYLERVYGAKVKCQITGPARCAKKQEEVYGKPGVTSYHLGINRTHVKGEPGVALDIICSYQKDPAEPWVTIPKAELAKHAIASKLFGGVIHKIYGAASRFLHVDLGPVREA